MTATRFRIRRCRRIHKSAPIVPFLATVSDIGTADLHTFRWEVIDTFTGLVVKRSTGSRFDFIPPTGGTFLVNLYTLDDDGGESLTGTVLEVTSFERLVSIDVPAGPHVEGRPSHSPAPLRLRSPPVSAISGKFARMMK